jgi:hypothetical protein
MTHIRGYCPSRSDFDGEKSELIGFEFGFSLILKVGVGAVNGDIDINLKSIPEPTPLISNYILPFIN